MTMHAVADALLRHHGVDSAEIMASAAPCWTRIRQAIEATRSLSMMSMDVTAGRLLFSQLRERKGGIRLELGSSWAHPAETTLLIIGSHLPESLLVAACRMPLPSVVGHAAFDGMDVRILSAENETGERGPQVRLLLEYRHVALGHPPAGAATEWLAGELAAA
jgi:hypothetical protein